MGTEVAAGVNPFSITADPAGRFTYVSNSGTNDLKTCSIDPGTGTLIEVPGLGTTPTPRSITVEPRGRFAFVAIDAANGSIETYNIDPVNGTLSSNGTNTLGGWSQTREVTVEPKGRFVYFVDSDLGHIASYSIDQSTGVLTLQQALFLVGNTPRAIAVDPSGRFVYMTNEGSSNVTIFSINQLNGELSQTGTVAAGSAPGAITVLGGSR